MACLPKGLPEGSPLYHNTYECPCGNVWEDHWDCGCDDDCAACGRTISPSVSECVRAGAGEPSYERLAALETELYALVPPIDPPALYWLSSDATYSYCQPCAEKARLEELGLPGWPDVGSGFTWERTTEQEAAAELAQEIEGGIDGGFEQLPSDCPESCETCGCTLRHTLTDYGVSAELAHFAANPGFATFGPEDAYTVSRICMNLSWSGAQAKQVSEAIAIVQDALQTARSPVVQL